MACKLFYDVVLTTICAYLWQAGDLEAMIEPQLLARLESTPDLYRPVDFSLPVGPIFQAVSGQLCLLSKLLYV